MTTLDPSPALQFLASTSPGTEPVLCEELRELGFGSVRLNRGGIPFRGNWVEGWRACLESRIAQRIQVLLHRFPAPTPEALYAGVQEVDWRPWLTYRQTLAVSAVVRSGAIRHSGFAALKAKDAIVDQVRGADGRRPSVSRDDPDVRVFLYLVEDKASLYLDLSGAPLHRRGYRRHIGEAPMKETLAAALLRLSGWDRSLPLIDPMCGSGTLAIEGALWAMNRAPGIGRERFGFERWASFSEEDARALRTLRGALRAAEAGSTARIQASDTDADALEAARANARAAGVRLSFRQRSVFDLQAGGGRAVVVTNPPYGQRLDSGEDFCRQVAAALCRLHGWRVCLLAGDEDYQRLIPPAPVAETALPNGNLPCRFLVYEMP